MNETMKFIKKFQECVREYKKQQRETTGEDQEIAHFFNNTLKNWLLDHEDEIRALSTSNCERPFMTFVIHYIYQ